MRYYRVLIIHNYYQIAGGEDAVMQNEIDLLIANGNVVKTHTVDNDNITSLIAKVTTLLNVPFSYSQYRKMLKVLIAEKPDVVHVHNYFPRLSPAIFYACKKANVPVVHTLHNYRAVCPTALLMHDGKINETSIKNSAWWTVSKRVYRDSLVGTFALTCMVELHKALGTWQTKVDRFIALTEFSRNKYIEAGWPSTKVVVKPNFIEDPFNQQTHIDKKGGYALYVGRLSEEKGIDVLFDAWKNCKLPLKVIGDGPLKNMVEHNAIASIEFLGRKDKPQVLELVKNADLIIMPSTWYEGFPMVLVEAFACGTPALVSKLGSMEEIIIPEKTGLHFEAGNADDLAEKVQWMVDNPDEARQMGQNARKEYLEKYPPEKNVEMLVDIYQQAIVEAGRADIEVKI
ncbi:MAG: glycosyltransferase family 4 protein [Alteromonadaceae bacterium]|nr:glycosyltransferase family 4 protein [Alteromonadaceae bacterium]